MNPVQLTTSNLSPTGMEFHPVYSQRHGAMFNMNNHITMPPLPPFSVAQERPPLPLEGYPTQHMFGLPHMINTFTAHRLTTPMVHPFGPMSTPLQTPPAAHSQLPSTDHRNSRNELRAAIFERVLGTFPKLQKMFHESSKPKEEGASKPSCRFQTPSPSNILPSMVDDLLDDEMDQGYFSFNDGISPKSSARVPSPTGAIPRYSPVMDLPPYITQLLDQVFDNTPDLIDMMTNSPSTSPDSKENIIPSASSSPEQYQALELTKKPLSPHTLSISKSKSRKFVCEICDKEFASKANLRVHHRRHSGDKPYQCGWCKKAFNQKSTLRTHTRIHTGERPYKCVHCEKTFADYSTFTKHLRTHTGEKPYSCSVCGKTFAQSGNMIRHQQTHKETRIFKEPSPTTL